MKTEQNLNLQMRGQLNEMGGYKTLFLKQCNPKIKKSGLLIFEVPKDGIYNLHLSGGLWNDKTAIVKLVYK